MKHILALLIAATVTACGVSKDPKPEPRPVPSESPSPAPTVDPVPSPAPSVEPSPEPSPSPSPKPVVDYDGPESVRPYVEDFVADAIIQGMDVSSELVNPKLQIQIAKLDNLGATVIGLCETGGIRRVTLDPDFWDNVSETQRKLLVHHELGHCVLLRPHTSATGVIPDGSGHTHELSIMYPIIFGDLQYTTHEAHYQKELFLSPASSGMNKVQICE